MKCYCDNCDWTGSEEELGKTINQIHHLAERLDVGGEVPAGECPECACLAYIDKPEISPESNPLDVPKMKTISFKVSEFEHSLLEKIEDRALAMIKKIGIDYQPADLLMDLRACHANGAPLDLSKLLAAPYADFGHDIFGIRRYLNRQTGELERCFVPRCALSKVMP
jgi:uncharacterized protein DUF6874